MKYYPAFLNIKGRRVLIVGAGAVAFQKIPALLESEANVCLVAPQGIADIEELAEAGRVQWVRRAYRPSDLKHAALVIAATDDAALQKRVADDARKRGIWVNVVDVTPLCDFIAPAVVSRGPVQIAVSTGGASPALAKFIRQKLEPMFGEEYGQLADVLRRYRPRILKLSKNHRQAVWGAIISQDFLGRIKKDGVHTAEARIQDLLHGKSIV